MNAQLKKAKADFKNDFFKFMKNAVFGKFIENMRKHIKLVTIKTIGNWSVSEPGYHITKCFYENVLTLQMKKLYIH